jgi:hypothetical protein
MGVYERGYYQHMALTLLALYRLCPICPQSL